MSSEARTPDDDVSSPLILRAERTVPAELTGPGWDAAVRELRSVFGLDGVVQGSGAQREWWSTNPGREGMQVRVRAVEDGGTTRLSVHQDGRSVRIITLTFAAGFVAFALFFAVLGWVSESGRAEWSVAAAMLVLAAAAAATARWGTRAWAERQGARITEAADRVERALGEAGPSR